jgi:hypothetical protein
MQTLAPAHAAYCRRRSAPGRSLHPTISEFSCDASALPTATLKPQNVPLYWPSGLRKMVFAKSSAQNNPCKMDFTEPSAKNKNPTEAGIVIIPHPGRQCQFQLGYSEVTEVSQPKTRLYPDSMNLAGAPGIPRPDRSSGLTPLSRNPLRCLPAAC